MTRALWLSALALAWPFVAANAQELTETAVEESAQQGVEPAAEQDGRNEPTKDIVVVGAPRRRDHAMDAFLRGDYERAEIGFRRNLECAERIEALQDYSRHGLDGAIAAARMRDGLRSRRMTSGRTCERPEWQLYMIGLSQVQQDKFEDARAAFYRVIRLSNDEFLYDAHYRIGLLELLAGNVERAEERLSYLTALLHRCRRRGDRCEIHDEVEESVAYLARAIGDAQAKTSNQSGALQE